MGGGTDFADSPSMVTHTSTEAEPSLFHPTVPSTTASKNDGNDKKKKPTVGDRGPTDTNFSEDNMDWKLYRFDEAQSEAQSLRDEMKRLQILRSYLILDSKKEYPFERLTALASRMLDVPIAVVSLIDLGRQWFMSTKGLGDPVETDRRSAFCAHTILSKQDVFIVRDATKDYRFCDNPVVTGDPNVRFYAGAPLLAPEGVKLGTLCVVDDKPRPNGIDLEFKQNLTELAALAVDALVKRRKKKEQKLQGYEKLAACTAHDLLTPLSGIELSLSLLKDDKEFQQKLSTEQQQKLTTATSCSEVVEKLCKGMRETFHEDGKKDAASVVKGQMETFNVNGMIETIYKLMESIPKQVPLLITVDKDVPEDILSDQTRIIRCALSYLKLACARTKQGRISLRVLVDNNASRMKKLMFECHDTAPPIEAAKYNELFKASNDSIKLPSPEKSGNSDKSNLVDPSLALYSVAAQMTEISGEFGFRPAEKDDNNALDKNGGSVFWFSIPFRLPGQELSTLNNVQSAWHAKRKARNTSRSSITKLDAEKFHRSVEGLSFNKSDLQSGPSTGMTTADKTSDTKTEAPVNLSEKVITERRSLQALVIEDSTVVRKMLTKILAKNGYDVSQAENGLIGLQKLKEKLFDIVLCDFLMPVMDGLDCVKQYREWEEDHRAKLSQRIIGISAHASEVDIEKGYNAGMNAFKPKPVTAKHITELKESEDQIEFTAKLDKFIIEGANISSSMPFPISPQAKKDDRDVMMPQPAKVNMEVTTSVNVTDSASNNKDHTNNSSNDEGITKPGGKRDSGYLRSKGLVKFNKSCLVAVIGFSGKEKDRFQKAMKELGYDCAFVREPEEVFAMLKIRVWDLVVIDEFIPNMIVSFREWEKSGLRKIRQNNLLLLATPGAEVFENVPEYVDGVLSKPLGFNRIQEWSDLVEKQKERKE